MADKDFNAASLAYGANLANELQQEALTEFQELGRFCGVVISSLEEITPEFLEALPTLLARQLERWGNPALAERLRQAYAQIAQALREQEELLELQEARPLTPTEAQREPALAELIAEAGERFDQVRAEVSEYIKHVGRRDEDRT